MDEKELHEIFSDEAFVRSLFELSSVNEVQAALREKGLELSLKELEAVKQRLNAQNGEMAEEELANVAGGATGFILPYLPSPPTGRLR